MNSDYTAYEKMKTIIKEKWNLDVDGPCEPERFQQSRVWERTEEKNKKSGQLKFYQVDSELEVKAIDFIRERCVELRFDRNKMEMTDNDGTSLKANQIPYNFQMDIDRRCFEVAIHRFLESGTAKEAFDVYFCYLEMFIGTYEKTKKMIEMLSEFEKNASSLLMKHRDHYSHSVYVFLIGLAFYQSSDEFRNAYKNKYEKFVKFESDSDQKIRERNLAAHFLKYWGLTALFHDVGYPFELSFEQVKSYFKKDTEKTNVPFVTFNMNNFMNEEKLIDKMKTLKLGETDGYVKDVNTFLAESFYEELKEDFDESEEAKKKNFYKNYLYKIIKDKPSHPEDFSNYMDHAYFSTVILLNTLLGILKDNELDKMITHSLISILLHNSLYKISIAPLNKDKYLSMEKHPLAYLLMLCDELQCWDRTSYGQNSRGEIHPFDCKLTFKDSEITAEYLFDSNTYMKDGKLKAEYKNKKGTHKKLDDTPSKTCEFVSDISDIIDINHNNNNVTLEVFKTFKENKRYRKSYLSSSDFIHFYQFAVLLHKMNHLNVEVTDKKEIEKLEDEFESMSLEYKINHISRAKKFASIINKADCFYSDKPFDCEVVTEFDSEELEKIMGKVEHERWCWEHWIVGWRHIDSQKFNELKADFEKVKKENNLPKELDIRECTKLHKDMPDCTEYNEKTGLEHYVELQEDDKKKDKNPIQNLLKILALEDGIKVYRLRV